MNHHFIPNQKNGGNDRIQTANEGISGLLTPTETSREKTDAERFKTPRNSHVTPW